MTGAPLPSYLLPDSAGSTPDGHLTVGGVDTIELASRFGTPLFVYDEQHLRDRAREAVSAFGSGATYAAKAFLCKAMARLAHDEGMAIDVSTGGELYVALESGVPPERLILHGNNKSVAELELAIQSNVGLIVIDSFDELDRLDALVPTARPIQVLIRITPGVEAHTHEFISTGQDDSKFGFTVSTGDASRAFERAGRSPSLVVRGAHAHIGSQVFRVESFVEAMDVIGDFALAHDCEVLSIGGGLGVAYVEGETAPTITEWADAVKDAAGDKGVTSTLMAEPGRAITASSAVTLYTAGTIKEIPGVRTYVAVDGGMSDNPRPILYGSGYETFLPRAFTEPRDKPVRLVGKHCETGDLLVSEGSLPSDLRVGDIVATPVTGAYGHSMGSNYNKVLRPSVVFVSDGEARQVVRRESYEDLLITDLG